MTNRIDMIDQAVLRPGWLEIHQEIGLPTYEGRKQIFWIHTRTPASNGLVADDVDFDYLAEHTKNFTGAEIEGICRDAVQWVLFKGVDINNLKWIDVKEAAKWQVEMEDFKHAI